MSTMVSSFDEFISGVLKEVETGSLSIHGWVLELTIPNSEIRDRALTHATGKEGNQFFYIYRRWIAAGCITALTSPSGQRTVIPSSGSIVLPKNGQPTDENSTGERVDITEYTARLLGVLPYPVLDAVYREVNKLKDSYVKKANLPVDDGVVNLQSTLEKVFGVVSGDIPTTEESTAVPISEELKA